MSLGQVDLPILTIATMHSWASLPPRASRCSAIALAPAFPVLASAERAMLVVIAFDYFETSVGPYGEIGIVIRAPTVARRHLCRWRSSPSSRLGQLCAASAGHLARRARCRPGHRGYTKFVSEWTLSASVYQRVRLAEGNSHILTLTVQQSGLTLKTIAFITYSVPERPVAQDRCASRSVYQLGLTPGRQAGTG